MTQYLQIQNIVINSKLPLNSACTSLNLYQVSNRYRILKRTDYNKYRGVITDLRKLHPCEAERVQLSLFMARGPGSGPLVGSRGNTPVGVEGAKPPPPEAPGLLHVKNTQEAF